MPVDRSAIDAQLREIGEGERWWEQREFRDLPHVLHPEESLRGIVTGKLIGSNWPRLKAAGRWLIVATDQRLICMKQERFGRKQVDIGAGQIVRIGQRSRLRTHQITIDTALRRYRLLLPREDAFRFSGALGPLMPASPVHRLSPELEPLAWIPGMTTVAALPGVSGIVSKVMMLSPPDPVTRERDSGRDRAQMEKLDARLERLQNEVEQLQMQVAFLEDLLGQRADEAMLRSAESRRSAGATGG